MFPKVGDTKQEERIRTVSVLELPQDLLALVDWFKIKRALEISNLMILLYHSLRQKGGVYRPKMYHRLPTMLSIMNCA
jgi:hypothetical protein